MLGLLYELVTLSSNGFIRLNKTIMTIVTKIPLIRLNGKIPKMIELNKAVPVSIGKFKK